MWKKYNINLFRLTTHLWSSKETFKKEPNSTMI